MRRWLTVFLLAAALVIAYIDRTNLSVALAASEFKLYFHFTSTAPLHFGVAIWSDPTYLGISGPNVSISGHAAAVAVFDIPQGASDQSITCLKCVNATLPLSL